MTEAELRALIAGGETYTVEFKSEEGAALSDSELVEATVCLANGEGGHILVGVENDGRLTGARPRHEAGTTDPDRVRALIANRTQPALQTEVEVLSLSGRSVLVISVANPPRVVGTTDGRYTRRAIGGDGKPACVPFHAHEMLAHEIGRGALDYAAIEIPGAECAEASRRARGATADRLSPSRLL